MYAYIEGKIDEICEASIILDHNGMGYEIFMPQSDLNLLSVNQNMRVHTQFQVSENAVTLYGFMEKEEKDLFRKLTSVNGVGPKAAIAILGSLSVKELRFAILDEDVKSLSLAPGVGAKTAKRIILDLKDKIEYNPVSEEDATLLAQRDSFPQVKQDAMAALMALGYTSQEVASVFSELSVQEDSSVEELIRDALKRM